MSVPTLTVFALPVASGNEDSEIMVTYADLINQGDEADEDGSVDSFVIKAISSGTLKIGASAEEAMDWDADTNYIVDAFHHAYWTPDPNANGTLAAFTAVAKDNAGEESLTPIQVEVAVIEVNDAPNATNLNQTIVYTEDMAAAIGTIVITDPDTTNIFTATVTLAGGGSAIGSLTAGSNHGESYKADTGKWTITGSKTEVNAALAALSFVPVANGFLNTTATVSISDGSALPPLAGTLTFNGTAVNDAPGASNLNQTIAYTEDTTTPIADIVITDPDADTFTATVMMAGNNSAIGSLTASSGHGESYNAANGVWTVTGSKGNVNAALAAMAFVPVANGFANTTALVAISDGVAPAVIGTLTFNGIPVNDAPGASNLNQTIAYTEDTTATIADIVITDPDADTFTATVRMAGNNSAIGSLTASSGHGESYNAATGVWTVTGSKDNVNAALAAMAFVPVANGFANTSATVSISDGSALPPLAGTLTFNGTAVNDAPGASNLNQTIAYTEDTTATIADIVITDPDADTLTATVMMAGNNSAIGSLTASSGHGESYNAATGVWTVTGSKDYVNAALAAMAFVPVANGFLNTTATVSISDGSALPPLTGTLTFKGTAVNDAPGASNLNQTIAYTEDTTATIADIVITDPDADTFTATVTMAGGNSTIGSLTASSGHGESYNVATGVWTVTGSKDYVNAALAALSFVPVANGFANTTATVSISDGSALPPLAGTLTFNGSAVNDAPTLTAFPSAIANGNEDNQITVSFANLKAQDNYADVDGTVTAFVIKAVSSGTLMIGTSAGTATAWAAGSNDTVDATHQAYWTPAANANGTLNAFTVVAKDNNGAESATPIQATVAVAPVNDRPTLTTFLGPVASGNEDNQITVSFADLVGKGVGDNGDVVDVDGNLTAFVIKAVSTGTLKIGTSAGTATLWTAGSNDIVDATHQAYWIPDANASGSLNAFTVVAKDSNGFISLTPPVQATVAVTAASSLINIQQTGVNTSVTEGRGSDSYSLALMSAPTADVIIKLDLTNKQVANISQSTLIFTTANWAIPQSVTVVAINDTVGEGMHRGAIQHTTFSLDNHYNGVAIEVTVSITDNDLRLTDPIFAEPIPNVFGLTNVGASDKPTFADIDGDGDLDAFARNNYSEILFYRNRGTASNPGFNDPIANYFGLTNFSGSANPTFADIDGDGDLDVFVGNFGGKALFYRNIGTASKPDFAAPIANKFGLDEAGYSTSPTFADIDGDGDLDAFVANNYGDTLFYRNLGTSIVPVFEDFGTNRFGLTSNGYFANLTFADIDGDRDLDAFAGNANGDTLFYRNTGNASSPAFEAPVTNAFGLTNVYGANPTFVDIDGDGDLDAFVGNSYGDTLFYRNDTAPIAKNFNQTIAYTEDKTAAIADITIIDPEPDTFTATVTMAGGNSAIGSLTANSGYGETYSTATGVWTVTGTKAIVQAALAAMSFVPVANGFANTTASVSITDHIAPAITGTLTFNGIGVNDAPVLKTPSAISYIDTVFDNTFATAIGSFDGSDVDGNKLTYGITGGKNNGDGTISKSSAYGVLTVTKSTGAYTFVPNDAAIEALTAVKSISFTVTVSDGLLSNNETLAINITQNGKTESNGNDILTGTPANDKFAGLAGNDILKGLAGKDILDGGAGKDRLNGGTGADTLNGGIGNDVYFVDNKGDKVIESSTLATEIDTVNSSINYTLTVNVENLTLTGTAAINGTGNALKNILTGNDAANKLNGLAGEDSMIGGAGNDVYVVDNIGDQVIETSNLAAEIDTVKSSISYTLGANLEKLTLTGTAAINGTGNALNNMLNGNAATNILNGDAGNDNLQGGLGDDVLTGGAGEDIFKLTNFSKDTITDFSVDDDTIQLENSVFTQLTATGVLKAANFRIGTAAIDANDYVIYDPGTGTLSYDADGSGAGVATQIAQITLVGINLELNRADFVVI
jgi:Ca2+-binding RTX toxin-like protein/bifunctional DNase/RNase